MIQAEPACPYCGAMVAPPGVEPCVCPGCQKWLLPVFPPGTRQFGGWLPAVVAGCQMLGLAGSGGMGRVYAARVLQEHQTGRAVGTRVAVKFPLLGEEPGGVAEERFASEVALLQRTRHPNIVAYLAHGVEAGKPYCVMEWVDGVSLDQLLSRCRETKQGVPFAFGVNCLRQVCEALRELHSLGLIHRDITPRNILVSEKQRFKVIDLGIARPVHTGETTAGTAAAFGTAAYMAPEQMVPGQAVDHRADLYACGFVVYELLTGMLPRGMVKSASSYNTTVPAWFDDLLGRLMEPRADERIASAAEVVHILETQKRPAEAVSVVPKNPAEACPQPEKSSDSSETTQGGHPPLPEAPTNSRVPLPNAILTCALAGAFWGVLVGLASVLTNKAPIVEALVLMVCYPVLIAAGSALFILPIRWTLTAMRQGPAPHDDNANSPATPELQSRTWWVFLKEAMIPILGVVVMSSWRSLRVGPKRAITLV